MWFIYKLDNNFSMSAHSRSGLSGLVFWYFYAIRDNFVCSVRYCIVIYVLVVFIVWGWEVDRGVPVCQTAVPEYANNWSVQENHYRGSTTTSLDTGNQLSIVFVLVNSREAIAAFIGDIVVFYNPKDLDCIGVLSRGFLQSKGFGLYWCAVFFKDLFMLFSAFSRQWEVKLEWWF